MHSQRASDSGCNAIVMLLPAVIPGVGAIEESIFFRSGRASRNSVKSIRSATNTERWNTNCASGGAGGCE